MVSKNYWQSKGGSFVILENILYVRTLEKDNTFEIIFKTGDTLTIIGDSSKEAAFSNRESLIEALKNYYTRFHKK